MSQDNKNIAILIVGAAIVIIVMLWLVDAYSEPCTRPYPNAQTIIDCQKLQPTNTR